MSPASITSPPAQPVIAILGSLNIDLVSYAPRHPLPGETMTSSHFETACGGKGANQAVACAKLSRSSKLLDSTVEVAMIGAVGNDPHGAVLLDSLQASGVDISRVSVRENQAPADAESRTGTAVIIVDESTAQNRILLAPGANQSAGEDHIAQLLAMDPKPSLLVLQLEIPSATTLRAIQAAKASGISVLLNPAPAIQLPEDVYNSLTHLVLNETEAALLSSVEEADLEDVTTLERVTSRFLSSGVRYVVVTLGSRGSYYATSEGSSGFVPAVKVDAVDTTAAGDTFIGSYAVSVVTDASRDEPFGMAEAVSRASAASARAVSRKGAQSSIPWLNELSSA